MKIIALIPARGKSKGIPAKNIRIINGKPLIAYTIEQALQSAQFTDVFVNTDSEEIAEISLKYGAKIPFLRPESLAEDNSKTIDVVRHAIPIYEKLSDFQAVMLLQPTTPFRRKKDYEQVAFFLETGSKCVVSYSEPSEHPSRMRYIDSSGISEIMNEHNSLRRQELAAVFVRNGAFYGFLKNLPFEEETLISKIHTPLFMDRFGGINIDTPFDMAVAELLLKQYYNNDFFEKGEVFGHF